VIVPRPLPSASEGRSLAGNGGAVVSRATCTGLAGPVEDRGNTRPPSAWRAPMAGTDMTARMTDGSRTSLRLGTALLLA
jgi:hypothetical protein